MIEETLSWLDNWVIKHNLCPWAAGVRRNTRTVVCHDASRALECIDDEAVRLRAVDADQQATTLVVLPGLSTQFDELMYLQEAAEARINVDDARQGPPIQLLAFHPHAEFDRPEDPADVALRSPWPLIHLLRDADVVAAEEQWQVAHGAPPAVQEANAAYLRGLGFEAASAAADEAVRTATSSRPKSAREGVERKLGVVWRASGTVNRTE